MKPHPHRKEPPGRFGRAVRERREALNQSQATLAVLIGVSPATLLRVELGKHRPTQKVEEKIRRVLKDLPPLDEEVAP